MRFIIPLLCISLLAAGQDEGVPVVTLMTHMGHVQYNQGEGWRAVTGGQQFLTGDSIRTGDDGFAELHHRGTRIQIQPNTQFKIASGEDQGKSMSNLAMAWGKVTMTVKKLGKRDAPYIITTPASIAAVRGTEYSVATGQDGTTLVQVFQGAVAVAGESKEVQVRANQETDVPYGGDPSKVRILSRVEWDVWLKESSEQARGNELRIMKISLERVESMDRDIQIIEQNDRAMKEKSAELTKKAQEYKEAGDEENFKKYRADAYRARRSGFTGVSKAYYQADRIEVVRNFALSVAQTVPDDREVQDVMKKIDEIYKKYYDTYIMEIYRSRKARGLIK